MSEEIKPKRPSPNPDGREPFAHPTKEEILKLAARHWTVTSMAGLFGVSRDLIYDRCSATEINAAKEGTVDKLRQTLLARAMGGKTIRKNDDGTETIVFMKSSERLLEVALNRFDGPVKQKVEIETPADSAVNIKLDKDSIREILAELKSDY